VRADVAAMRTTMQTMTIAAATLLMAGRAAAVELASTWKLEDTRRYRYEETANVGGVALGLRSTFVERARALRGDGGVDLDITVEALEVCRGQPQRCERLRLDAATQTLHAISDRKGRLIVPHAPTVTVRDGHVRLHAGAAPASAREAVLEIVPLRLFALLALPDGAVVPGTPVKLQLASGVARWTLAAIDRGLAHVRVTMGVRPKVSADVAASYAVAGGALLEAGGVLIGWQPVKRNAVVRLERR
jgi:hypothetical protein